MSLLDTRKTSACLERRAFFWTHKGRSGILIEHRNDPKAGYAFRSDALARSALLAGAVALAALASACTVRPLYSNAPLSAASTASAQAELASIAIKPVNTRYAQQVRNHLVFAFNGGRERTSNPAYSLDLGVSELLETAVNVQIRTDIDQPTAGTVTLISRYRLTEAATGAVVATGNRSVSASYDKPPQEFASYRALIDAENRAARELAQFLNLAIAQDLAKR